MVERGKLVVWALGGGIPPVRLELNGLDVLSLLTIVVASHRAPDLLFCPLPWYDRMVRSVRANLVGFVPAGKEQTWFTDEEEEEEEDDDEGGVDESLFNLEFCVAVKLNANRMVVGTLRGFDQFMNLVVDNTEEVNGNERTDIGMVVIRGNSVVTVEALEPVSRAQ
ncbi:hypothetical protein RHMOL_Rhmol06G0181200 [Rhododendron molle]|uniref:Uncharacterized protein n=1 Tax=Rhododendron molle TaxID=49168 RepID=A0ACC0NFX0_RHOML|nr:hypothetical protein RHMOL_Rhmol06G0181200 [Rhododendron molle]